MKRVLNIVVLLLVAAFLCHAHAQNNKSVLGEWKYTVSDAPYGYDRGVVVISEKDKALLGEVKFDSGYSIKLSDLSFKNDTLKANAFVEGQNISLIAKVAGYQMNGTVDTPQGKLKLTGEKLKKGKKK